MFNNESLIQKNEQKSSIDKVPGQMLPSVRCAILAGNDNSDAGIGQGEPHCVRTPHRQVALHA